MSVLDKFENGVEGAVDRAAGAVFKSPIEPAQVAKVAVKQMKQHKLVGAGRQYAPTLYNVLINATDDKRLFGFYPTMAAELETHLLSKGADLGLEFDGRPLVRFIPDPKLKRGRFDVIAENVSAQIILQLREEELEYYGLKPKNPPTPQRESIQHALSQYQTSNNQIRAAQPNDPFAPPAAGANFAAGAPIAAAAAPATPAASTASDVAPAASALVGAPAAALAFEPTLGSAVLYNTTTNEVTTLRARQLVLGRDLDCDIPIHDANASRRHAALEQNATGSWKLIDQNSTNGTLLNDRPISQAALRDGDLITIGTTVLEFRA